MIIHLSYEYIPLTTTPSFRVRKNGWYLGTNVTSSIPSSLSPPRYVRTTFSGKGDPGYSLAAGMYNATLDGT